MIRTVCQSDSQIPFYRGVFVTSEICLMNRLGVVLAADSATTVTYWNGNADEVRYFKGANKIFQLTDHHPVGIMIYNSVDALHVPWEVVIKEFRRTLGSKSFNSVAGYADEFLTFINNDQRIFPAEARRAEFEDVLNRSILKVLVNFREDHKAGKVADLRAYFDNLLQNGLVDQDKVKFNLQNISSLRQIFGDATQEKFNEWLGIIELTFEPLSEPEIDIILGIALEDIKSISPSTGLVMAGFGDHSVFPEVVHLKNCQFWYDHFCESERVLEGTSYDVPAIISGYAQTSMIDTLRMGFSDDVLGSIARDSTKHCDALVDSVAASVGGVVSEEDKSAFVGKAVKQIIDGLFDYARAQHYVPLRRVVGVLPIDEMSTLAETLINLQSLKEKVTKPSETVGGPVDVAAITRSEGLVWVKRKHYFSPEINSRFFERRGR
ncbi:MAG: hypothetical protein JWS10_1528 [Cypionkella sp.]|uniref:hypothetical protein n=1 Tax=Cypionkella sp. TaxID=2811411 RepID=UPI002626BACC|nr:hypothetical protein [Cypionkella sp.]MDB5658913.1 hypothetical protein [Cypionkella sp.]